jgi:hypothetical protein
MTPRNQRQLPKQPVAKKVKPRWGRIILWSLLLIFMIMQFFQPDKNNNNVVLSNDISSVVTVPDDVNLLLHSACYDCHSNNTDYPWYTNIQPIGWWLNDHINNGKRHLNFNEFATYTLERKRETLEEVGKSVKEGWMPLNSYTWMHKDAKLTDAQKQTIINWAEGAKKIVASAP